MFRFVQRALARKSPVFHCEVSLRLEAVPLTCLALLCASPFSVRAEAAERLYVGTGEYSASEDWDAIMRFENADTLQSGIACATPYAPDGLMPVMDLNDADGIELGFAHSIYVDEVADEMYVASVFTIEDPGVLIALPPCKPGQTPAPTCYSDPIGSIGIISNASTATGPQTLSRHIFRDANPDITMLNQPHSVWLDESRDMLYVSNSGSFNVLVFHNASSADGNIAPDRSINNDLMGAPIFAFVDSDTDRLFIASFADEVNTFEPAVLIYENASTLNGDVEPDYRIIGDMTRLAEGTLEITHNVWYDTDTSHLYVCHHTNEVLKYNLTGLFDGSPPAPLNCVPDVSGRLDCNTPPEWTLRINAEDDDSDADAFSAYGIFLIPQLDRLYVSNGFRTNVPGTEHVVKVYDGVKFRANSPGDPIEPPDQVICWGTLAETYYPPQALWVTVTIGDELLPVGPWAVSLLVGTIFGLGAYLTASELNRKGRKQCPDKSVA